MWSAHHRAACEHLGVGYLARGFLKKSSWHCDGCLISNAFVVRLTVIWGGRWMSSRRCWSDTRSGSSSAWPWARSSLLRRWVLKARNICYFRFQMFTISGPISRLGQAGEDGVQGQEHAGPPSSGPLHHRTTRSLLHRAVDGRIRLPEPHQVSARMKLKTGF